MKETQAQVNSYHSKDIWFYLREKGFEMFKFLASLIPADCKTILDAGCGQALILPHLPKDKIYTGFDLSDFAINKNKNTYKDYPARFVADDLFNPSLNDKFDCVLLLSVFAQLTPSEILDVVSIAKNRFNPKIIIASSIEEHLTPAVIRKLKKEFNVVQELHKTFSLIDNSVGVGTPEQINNRVILLLER